MGLGLLTDLYELNMAASYLRRGMRESATFSLFVRDLPPTRGFVVAAGLQPCLDVLEGLRFEEEDLVYLRDVLGFEARDVDRFRDLRFTGDVRAVAEGRIVFADEPLLEVTAPIAESQLVETLLLNQVTLHATIASKAARCVIAARGRDLVDFAFRRTHGVDAAMAVARSTAMVGFAATSNVEAARRYGLRAAGTMAHSYVEAFESEREAFRAFARDFPGRTTFLVDTYDTLRGVRTAIEVIHELGLTEGLGVRLDSGDFETLARGARDLLDREGLTHVRIFVSGGIDDLDIDRLVRADAPIDAFGVGTHLGVSADAPFLDTVYKLVEYAGRPVAKLSTGKSTLPGPKQVFRGANPAQDILGTSTEPAPEGTKPLLETAMQHGRRLRDPEPISVARARFEADLAALPEPVRDLAAARSPRVEMTSGLRQLTSRVHARLRADRGSGPNAKARTESGSP